MSNPQFDLFESKNGKEAGQALVESHNEHFVERMRAQARRLCAINGTVTSDDLREAANDLGIRPRHPNAWGAIFHGDEWRAVSYTRSKLVSNHARTIRVWTLK